MLCNITQAQDCEEPVNVWFKVSNDQTNSNYGQVVAIDMSHGYSSTWDGHWNISNWRWFLLRGNRPYMINREPLSRHTSILKSCGLNIVKIDNYRKNPTLSSKQYKTQVSSSDKNVSDTFIQANVIRN